MLEQINLIVANQPVMVNLLNQQDLNHLSSQIFANQTDQNDKSNHVINIFASGSSILNVSFDESLLSVPSIFVNGSVSLLGKYHFTQPTAYVVSDERFIRHNLEVILTHYQGRLFCMTLPVLQALIKAAPEFVQQFYQQFRLIFAVDRPIVKKTGILSKILSLSDSYHVTKLSIDSLKNSPHAHCVWDFNHDPVIGVSLDITQGFVEAGTVAYVAAQLAFGLKPSQIHLYGIDLVNFAQPRFYENELNKAPIKLDKAIQNRIVPSFDLMAQVYARHQVKLFNHSPVSKNLFSHLAFMV